MKSLVAVSILATAIACALSLLTAKGGVMTPAYCTVCLQDGEAFSTGAHTMIGGVLFRCTPRGWEPAASCHGAPQMVYPEGHGGRPPTAPLGPAG